MLAGYILYGSSTVLVFTFGDGVHEFTLDPDTKDFYLSNERITIPDKCPYYSINEKNMRYMTEKDRNFVESLKTEKGCGGRYIGSLVADIHRTLIKGGVFLYSAIDKKGEGEYKGKLRLNYELKPMAFLIEQAGGLAIDGERNILDITPTKLHERTPIIAGNKNIIEDYLINNNMSEESYKDLNSQQEVESLVKESCAVGFDGINSINDQQKLQDDTIKSLAYNASVSENPEVKKASIFWINKIADFLKIESASNSEYYQKKANGDDQFFTVPAVKSRMVTFHTVRSAVRSADKLNIPHLILELALSEVGYTGQQKDEYSALCKAAYISLGLKNRKVYVQADHYQLDPKKYAIDKDAEMQRIKDAITKAIENGVYNIDLDSSKFETADPNKSDRENQGENARLTVELLHFIRSYEKSKNIPSVSVGGEVGEVGGENTKYPQVNAYLDMVSEHMTNLGAGHERGLDKISINVGSAHGGVLGPDGQPLDVVPLDFTAHHDLFMFGKDPMNPGRHVLAVQHGASTLPKRYFSLFPAMHVAEVHLATGFQNVIWEVLEKHDSVLYEKMKTMTFDKFGDKIAGHKTEAIGFMKERKRVTEFVKKELLMSGAVEEIEKALDNEFTAIFHSLYNLLQPKAGIVVEGDRSD